MPSRSRRSRTVVSLSGPADIAVAVPHLLGFVPHESVVVASLSGRRSRVGLVLRLDLEPPAYDEEIARALATRMALDGAAEVLVVVVTDAPDDDRRMPRADLVDALCAAMRVQEALLIRCGRWSSYVCDGPCCPRAGTPIDPQSAGAVTIAAAHAMAGHAVLPDRAALVASVAPVEGVAAAAMESAIERAAVEVAAVGPVAYAQCAADLAERLLARYDAPPATLTDDEAACLVVALDHVPFRDRMIVRIATRTDAARGLLLDLAPRALPPLDAPACTVLAWAAYAAGDGVVAAVALERSLSSDPGYSLAQLLHTALLGQVHPRKIRAMALEVAGQV